MYYNKSVYKGVYISYIDITGSVYMTVITLGQFFVVHVSCCQQGGLHFLSFFLSTIKVNSNFVSTWTTMMYQGYKYI